MKTALVFGGNGAVGRAVLKQLRTDKSLHAVSASRSDSSLDGYKIDICDLYQVEELIGRVQPDFIFNLTGSYSTKYEEAYYVNVESSRYILDSLLRLGMQTTRVLLIGSSAEYGIVRNEENPITEDRVLRPISLYALTKAWQTQLCTYYAGLGLNVVVGRVFNLLGPGISEKLFVGRIQKQIDEIFAGTRKYIEIGSLTAIRDYLPVDSAAEQLQAIIEYGESGSVYHVASGQPVTMRNVLDQYLSEYKIAYTLVRESEKYSNRVGYDVPEIYADITKISDLIKSRNKNESA